MRQPLLEAFPTWAGGRGLHPDIPSHVSHSREPPRLFQLLTFTHPFASMFVVVFFLIQKVSGNPKRSDIF